jgi:hypothetical protein
VRYISVYAFSIDNFQRSPEEVGALMHLAEEKYRELAAVGVSGKGGVGRGGRGGFYLVAKLAMALSATPTTCGFGCHHEWRVLQSPSQLWAHLSPCQPCHLLSLLCPQEDGLAERKGVEMRILGALDLAPPSVRGAAARLMQATAALKEKRAVLNICFSYTCVHPISMSCMLWWSAATYSM